MKTKESAASTANAPKQNLTRKAFILGAYVGMSDVRLPRNFEKVAGVLDRIDGELEGVAPQVGCDTTFSYVSGHVDVSATSFSKRNYIRWPYPKESTILRIKLANPNPIVFLYCIHT